MDAIRRLAVVVISLAIVGAAPAFSEPESPGANYLDPTRGAVFTGPAAHLLTDGFFSREDVGSLWDPTPGDISQLEEALGAELNHRLEAADTPVRDYYRQYAGIHLKGHRLIFVNGFHRAHVEETSAWLALPHPESELTSFPVGARNRDFWRRIPVQVDDGGTFFFVAFYDPQTRRIVGLQFNGLG